MKKELEDTEVDGSVICDPSAQKIVWVPESPDYDADNMPDWVDETREPVSSEESRRFRRKAWMYSFGSTGAAIGALDMIVPGPGYSGEILSTAYELTEGMGPEAQIAGLTGASALYMATTGALGACVGFSAGEIKDMLSGD